MRAFLFFAIFFVALPDQPAHAQGEVEATRVADNVYVIRGRVANMTVVDTGDGLVVVDTLISPLHARNARRVIADTFPGKRVRYVVNTHYHPDHQFGNQVYDDAIIIAHKNTARRMPETDEYSSQMLSAGDELSHLQAEYADVTDTTSESAAAIRAKINLWQTRQARFAGFRRRQPDIEIDGNTRISLGNTVAHLMHFGAAHTDGDLVVLFENERVLCVGDLAFHKTVPVIDTDGGVSIAGWRGALASLSSRASDYDHIVPGHGNVGGVIMLDDQRDLLTTVETSVIEAKENGFSKTQALARFHKAKISARFDNLEPMFGDIDGVFEQVWLLYKDDE